MKHSDVTISIVTATALEEAKRTLRVVLDTREGAKLILTANGNPDAAEYFTMLARQREGVEVIVNAENKGFIAPSNVAFEKCDTPFFALLNDDAIPAANWLDKMKAVIAPENVAIAGPGERWLDQDFVGHKWRAGCPTQPDFIEGSCLMVKAYLLRDLKEPLFWDELKLAYTEDADLCLRLRSRGWEMAVADFALEHKAGTTTRAVPFLHDAMRLNFGLCQKKWAGYLRTRRFA
jgi:GT2 family glycosyltransferase